MVGHIGNPAVRFLLVFSAFTVAIATQPEESARAAAPAVEPQPVEPQPAKAPEAAAIHLPAPQMLSAKK